MVIPVVGGGVIVALADRVLAFAMLAVALLFFGGVYWLLVNARGRLAGLPLVGGAAVTAVNLMIVFVQVNAYAANSIIQLQLHFASRALRVVLNYFLAPVLMPVMTMVQGVSNRVWDYDHNVFPRVQATFADVWAHIANYDFNVFPRIAATLVTLTNDATLLGLGLIAHDRRITGIESRVADYDQNVFPRVQAIFASHATAIAELQAFLPLLRDLAGFEAGAVGGIRTLGGRVATLERGEADLARDLARVLPLSVVVALGAAAVLNLERVARDPCHCLNAGGWSDLPDRISALEELGP